MRIGLTVKVFVCMFMLNCNAMSDTNLLLKRLQAFEFLCGLEANVLLRLAENSAWKVFAPDAVVFWVGDVESNLLYLQYGLLKI